MAGRRKSVVINLDLLARREPFAYAGLAAVPDECRMFTLRELITMGISSVGVPGAFAQPPRSEDEEARIAHKLTFFEDRPEDVELYRFFERISPGRRRSTARALLVKGLMLRESGVLQPPPPALPLAQPSFSRAPEIASKVLAQPRTETRPVEEPAAGLSTTVPSDLFAAIELRG